MSEGSPPPRITAASLQAREEWRSSFPGAEVIWAEEADEGKGIGFDGLDPSAMARANYRTTATWPDVLGWYREHLGSLGWEGKAVRDTWWEWTNPAHRGERFDLLDRTWVPDNLRAYVDPSAQFVYEVLFRVRGDTDIDPLAHA